METYNLTQLDALEAEGIHIMREVAAEFERPVLLFSGGKDSIVLLRLAEKAFRPARFPFPIMHIDTGSNFPEVVAFRDRVVHELGERLIVASVQDAIRDGICSPPPPGELSLNRQQAPTLVHAISENKFDAAFGGARRDEEKARAKERVFSFRDSFSQWDPKNQRPELWNLYNTRIHSGQHIRVFPLSNWTEMDVWRYIDREGIEVPNIYFAHERTIFMRDDQWLSTSDILIPRGREKVVTDTIRFRTIGDMVCTGAVFSSASSVPEIIDELSATRVTERGGRADDRFSDTAMEDRKKEGYF